MNAIAKVSASEVAAVVRDLPALPQIVTELIATIDRESVSVEQIAGRLSRDQVLSVKVLRLANSSFYGFPGRVTSVREALVVLGMRVVRSLVMAAGIARSFPPLPRDHPIADIWRHAFATATCARAIAATVRLDAEAAFTAGLIHDLGRLVLVLHFPIPYQTVLHTAQSEGKRLADVEPRVLGLDHAEVGYALACRWRLPDLVARAVGDHHHPPSAATPSLADIVQVADAIVHSLDVGEPSDECVAFLDVPSRERLAMTSDQLCGLRELAKKAWADAEALTN